MVTGPTTFISWAEEMMKGALNENHAPTRPVHETDSTPIHPPRQAPRLRSHAVLMGRIATPKAEVYGSGPSDSRPEPGVCRSGQSGQTVNLVA